MKEDSVSWFKIDDGFHCHTKVFAAGTPAVGLYVRCGSWAAQQVTDGVIPKHVAKMYGTPRMIKALVDAGLWHQRGHNCESCPELDANSYVIHQYLEKNPSRAETDAARKAKSERQQRWREGKRSTSADTEGDGSNIDSEPNTHRVGTNSEGNSHRVDDEFASSSGADHERGGDLEHGFGQVEGSRPRNVDGGVDASTRRHGDAAPVPSRPVPSSPPLTEEEKNKLASSDGEPTRIGDRPRIPDASRPLVDALTAARFVVGWDLKPAEWFLIEALIQRCGVGALVTSARASWQGARTQPRSASYFLPGWRALPDAPAARQDTGLPMAVGADIVPFQPARQIPTGDQRVTDAFNLAARLEAEEGTTS